MTSTTTTGSTRPDERNALRRPAVQYAGAGLIAAGLLAVLLGWYGLGGEKVVERQIPYLISGGFGGGALIAVGAFLLFVNEIRVLRQRVDDLHLVLHELDTSVVERVDAVLAELQAATNGSTRSKPRSTAADR